MGFLFPSQNSRLYCPPPSSKLWFQWGWLIKLKTAPSHPKTPILSTAASNLVCAVAVVGVYSCVISPTETFMQLGATKQIEVFAGEIKVLMTLRIMFDSRLTQWALYWVIAFFHPNVVRCLWGCLGFSLINIMLKKPWRESIWSSKQREGNGLFSINYSPESQWMQGFAPLRPGQCRDADLTALARPLSVLRRSTSSWHLVTWHVCSRHTAAVWDRLHRSPLKNGDGFNSTLGKTGQGKKSKAVDLKTVFRSRISLVIWSSGWLPPQKHIRVSPLIPSQVWVAKSADSQ